MSAERAQVRIQADAMERRAVRLADYEAGALWEAVASRHIMPLDYFEKGDRTYALLSSPEPAPTVAGGRLTRRESEVVGRVAAGFVTKEIAFELDVSPNTVGALLTSARNKRGVRSRVKLVEMGAQARAGSLSRRATAFSARREDGRAPPARRAAASGSVPATTILDT